jgi:SAM-dependent methyltransferase
VSAAAAWRRQLEAWALPEELLAAAEESPYGWPVELWRRRAETARQRGEDSPTTRVLRQLLPRGGSLLDVGAGTGRASLPLAEEGYRVVAVERDVGMVEGLRREAADRGVAVDVVEGSWPEVAPVVAPADVSLAAHVVYDVADIVPFLGAMAGHAQRGVVLELTETHPWSHLAPYYRALHRLERPDGPSVDDLAAVVEEALGAAPQLERWERPSDLWFASWEELVAFYGRRLVLPRDRWPELRELLSGEVESGDGRLTLTGSRRLATLWWRL